jgi:hypothetical protein
MPATSEEREMRTVTIIESPSFRVESTGNGWGYTFTHKPTGKSVWLQDEPASFFRWELENAESNFPDYDIEQIALMLWCDCEYGSIAQHMPVEPWGPFSRIATRLTFVPVIGRVEPIL